MLEYLLVKKKRGGGEGAEDTYIRFLCTNANKQFSQKES